ncbi:MAG: amidohydrolase [Deltaproteobacteria bacterium]|nr:amidohydrolase [Deltaproteobacteria bacterium]
MTNDWDLVISGGTLLTLSEKMEVIEDALVGVRDGAIRFVGKKGDGRPPEADSAETIDASGCIVMPGLINTHTHLPMVAFRGMADDMPLMEWLENHIFPAEGKYVNRQMVYDGALLAMAEMILSGTTTFCDGYFFEDRIAEAAAVAGMRAVVSQGFADFAMPDHPTRESVMAAADRFVRRWLPYAPMIAPAFFCHAPYTCSPATLTTVKEAARASGILYLTHLLETKGEIAQIEERYGKKPVRHLYDLGVLDDRTICVHCNWLTGEDMKIFADCGVKVSHNPESSMKLAAGVAPVPAMLERGIVVGLGTDGSASNNDLDMFGEMDTAAKVHKVASLDPTVMDARTVIRMATMEGARVLGLEKITGSIEVGKQADIIIIDLKKPHLTPLYNGYSHLVYAASGADVKTSIIGGKIVMRNRKLLTMDVGKVMENVRRIAENIKAGL